MSCEGCGLNPLYILQVSLAGPRTTVEAQAFYRMYHSYADIPNPWDRLRWCRYGLDLLQKEVAAMVGMVEWLYQDLESGAFHRSFTPELADKLAALYDKYDGFGNLRSLQVTGDGRAFLGGVQRPCCFQEDPAGRSEKTALTDESDLRDAYPHRCSVLRFQERRLQRPAGPASACVNRIS